MVDCFLGRAVEARGSDQEYCLGGTGGDNGFMGQMGFERKAPGTVSFYKDVVRQFRKAVDRDQGGGELVVFGRSSHAETAMMAQGGGQGLTSRDSGEEGDMGWRADMCGSSIEDCTKSLEFVGEEIEGGCFTAGAGEGCDAGPDGE